MTETEATTWVDMTKEQEAAFIRLAPYVYNRMLDARAYRSDPRLEWAVTAIRAACNGDANNLKLALYRMGIQPDERNAQYF